MQFVIWSTIQQQSVLEALVNHVQYFKAAVLVDPAHAAAWHAWGMLEKQEGNSIKARDLWIKVSPTPTLRSSLEDLSDAYIPTCF